MAGIVFSGYIPSLPHSLGSATFDFHLEGFRLLEKKISVFPHPSHSQSREKAPPSTQVLRPETWRCA